MTWWQIVVAVPAVVVALFVGTVVMAAWLAGYGLSLAAGTWACEWLEDRGWPHVVWVPAGVCVGLELAVIWTLVTFKLGEVLGMGEVPW